MRIRQSKLGKGKGICNSKYIILLNISQPHSNIFGNEFTEGFIRKIVESSRIFHSEGDFLVSGWLRGMLRRGLLVLGLLAGFRTFGGVLGRAGPIVLSDRIRADAARRLRLLCELRSAGPFCAGEVKNLRRMRTMSWQRRPF